MISQDLQSLLKLLGLLFRRVCSFEDTLMVHSPPSTGLGTRRSVESFLEGL